MADYKGMTEEQLEQLQEMIDLYGEQVRTGKKANEQAIKTWLAETKKGQAIEGVTKATTTLTKGFVDSATAIADSTGDFGALSGAVGGSIKSMTTLAGAVSDVFGAIPFAGQAIDAMGDAAIAFTKFGMGELQKSFTAFQDLSAAGQIGAGGIEEMATNMRKANLPLATYSKLLKENSTDLAFLSSSAIEGGKSFSKTMGDMANDAGMPLRRLGLSVEEIGDTVVDFQVMQRRQGLLGQLSQEQIRTGTEAYAKELDIIAKLTGKNRKEIQKEREEALSDSRFRAATAAMDDTTRQKHMDVLATIDNPALKRAYMDQLSGFTNSAASVQQEIVGMGNTIRKVIADINDQSGTAVEGANALILQQREITKPGGMFQRYSAVVESGIGPMGDYAQAADQGAKKLFKVGDVLDAQKKQLESVGSSADELAKVMKGLQSSASVMNSMFTKTETAAKLMAEFTKMQTDMIQYTESVLNSEKPFQKILDDAAREAEELLLSETQGIRQVATNIEGFIKELVYGEDEPSIMTEPPGSFTKAPLAYSEDGVPPPELLPTGAFPENVTANSHTLIGAQVKYNQDNISAKEKELATANTKAGSDGIWTPAEKARSEKLERELALMNKTLTKLLSATNNGITATKGVEKTLKNGM